MQYLQDFPSPGEKRSISKSSQARFKYLPQVNIKVNLRQVTALLLFQQPGSLMWYVTAAIVQVISTCISIT